MDISMIFHPVLEETVILANKNMILKHRGGRKMLTIQPTPREPSAINGALIPNTTTTNIYTAMKDVMNQK
uniref:Uncharacterized protein n=1 Tax=viral metagenome TaxID=1070528 RepID=A0A6C0DND5_9ZZZZ